jgi:hypothetical protein
VLWLCDIIVVQVPLPPGVDVELMTALVAVKGRSEDEQMSCMCELLKELEDQELQRAVEAQHDLDDKPLRQCLLELAVFDDSHPALRIIPASVMSRPHYSALMQVRFASQSVGHCADDRSQRVCADVVVWCAQLLYENTVSMRTEQLLRQRDARRSVWDPLPDRAVAGPAAVAASAPVDDDADEGHWLDKLDSPRGPGGDDGDGERKRDAGGGDDSKTRDVDDSDDLYSATMERTTSWISLTDPTPAGSTPQTPDAVLRWLVTVAECTEEEARLLPEVALDCGVLARLQVSEFEGYNLPTAVATRVCDFVRNGVWTVADRDRLFPRPVPPSPPSPPPTHVPAVPVDAVAVAVDDSVVVTPPRVDAPPTTTPPLTGRDSTGLMSPLTALHNRCREHGLGDLDTRKVLMACRSLKGLRAKTMEEVLAMGLSDDGVLVVLGTSMVDGGGAASMSSSSPVVKPAPERRPSTPTPLVLSPPDSAVSASPVRAGGDAGAYRFFVGVSKLFLLHGVMKL